MNAPTTYADMPAVPKVVVVETKDYPGASPHSTDSHLPEHLVAAAQAAIDSAEGWS